MNRKKPSQFDLNLSILHALNPKPMRIPEIARALDVPAQTIYSIERRALLKCKQQLQPILELENK